MIVISDWITCTTGPEHNWHTEILGTWHSQDPGFIYTLDWLTHNTNDITHELNEVGDGAGKHSTHRHHLRARAFISIVLLFECVTFVSVLALRLCQSLRFVCVSHCASALFRHQSLRNNIQCGMHASDESELWVECDSRRWLTVSCWLGRQLTWQSVNGLRLQSFIPW